MASAKTETAAAPSPPISLGWRFLIGSIGMALGLFVGTVIWAYDMLANQHHDYLVTGLTLALLLGGMGFFVAATKTGWRDALLYFLLLGFLDN